MRSVRGHDLRTWICIWKYVQCIIKPVSPCVDWDPLTWDYFLWHDIYVAPIVWPNVTVREVNLPSYNETNATMWADFWDHSKVYKAGEKIFYNVENFGFPVFQKGGSMLTLNITNSLNNHGDELFDGALTLLVSYPDKGGAETVSREWNQPSQTFQYYFDDQGVTLMKFEASAHERKVILLLRGVAISKDFLITRMNRNKSAERVPFFKDRSIMLKEPKESGWTYNDDKNELCIYLGDSRFGIKLSIHNISTLQII